MLLASLSFQRSTTLSRLSYTRLLQIFRPFPGSNSARCFHSSAVAAARPTRWSSSDDATLKKLWEQGACDREIAKQMQFSQTSIQKRRTRMGLASLFSRVPFTQTEDILILDAKAKGLTWDQISRLIPTRKRDHLNQHYLYALSPNAERTASRRGRRFSSEEDRTLLELRDDRRLAWIEMCQHIPGRGSRSLRSRYSYLKSADSRAVIMLESKHSSLLEPVRNLLRDGFSIRAIAARLGLTRKTANYLINKVKCPMNESGQGRKARKWTEEDKVKFRKLKAEGKTLVEIANELGRTYGAAARFAWKYDDR